MNHIQVTTPDGLTLAASTTGNPQGPEILFIHGFSQSRLSWMRQLQDPALAGAFRMAAYDLRGHGSSDKPAERERYRDDQLWADDLAAVIEATGLKKPTLVAWSYAGRVVSDYMRAHGQDRIAGIVYVAGVTKTDNAFWGPAIKLTGAMGSDDLAANIAATREFVRRCFEHPPSADDYETMLAFNMVVPPKVRVHVRDRTPDQGDMLPRIRVPALVMHGERDKIILAKAGQYTASQIPGGRLSMYDGIGHAPFMEDTPRFNRELAEFVHTAR